jgi:hypothetical protein
MGISDILWLVILLLLASLAWSISRGMKTTTSGPLYALRGDGTFSTEVVGELSYQQALEAICGGRCEEGVSKEVEAMLTLEDDNPHDKEAVRVNVGSEIVGYLSRDDARKYRRKLKRDGHARVTVTCPALIRGGWDRGSSDRGYFGIRLDLPTG